MKVQLTIFICLDNNNVIGVGKSLLKMYDNTPTIHTKSYHYFYRLMSGKDEVVFRFDNRDIKIIKTNYAK